MARKTIATKDASLSAASELEYVIQKRRTLEEEVNTPTVDVQSAMKGDRVYSSGVQRDVTRVLFISKNTELLNPTQQSLDGYIDLRDLFDEVHILILRTGIAPKQPVIRVADNVWIYTTAASVWWLMPSAGLEMVDEQMVFANGFRADLIVARDQFESAIVTYRLHQLYGAPIQLHVEQPREKVSYLHQLMARFMIPKFPSVRADTGYTLERLRKKYDIADLSMLPRYHNYADLIDRPNEIDLKHKHQPILFFMLYVGPLNHKSALPSVFKAAKPYLQNPRVGLIVIGDGPARGEFEKQAKKLGIESQVIFERAVVDVVAYYKSAHILIVPDTDTDSEEVVLSGAASGVPVIMAETERRLDLFVHSKSGFLYSPDNLSVVTSCIDELLNTIPLRHEMVAAAQAMIADTFHEDPAEYREAYRTSVEQALFVVPEEVKTPEERTNEEEDATEGATKEEAVVSSAA